MFSTALIVKLAALLIGSGGIAGMVAYVLHSQKKAGQKQAEAEYAQKQASDAAKSSAVLVEHRTADDAADRLSKSTF